MRECSSIGESTRFYTYNDQGNLQQYLDREGRKTTYQYDRLDRVTDEYWWNAADTGEIHRVHQEYDGLGRVVQAVDMDFPAGSSGPYTYAYQTYDYDALGRVLTELNYHPNAPSLTPGPKIWQQYYYDELAADTWQQHVQTRVEQWFTPDGETFTAPLATTVTYTDKQGRTARIEDAPDGQATKRVEFIYDDADKLIDVARTTAAGTFFFDSRYEYDNAGRVTAIEHYRDDDLTPFTSYAYSYDNADRIVELTTTHDTSIGAFSSLPQSVTEEFEFDLAGQLTESDSTVSGQDESFAYDQNGNRVGSEIETDDYNRLAEDADYTYEYDDEGNRTRRTADDGSYTVYTWDHRNRLTKVENFTGSSVIEEKIEYAYNADDLAVERERTIYDEGEVEDTLKDHSIYGGSKPVLEFDQEDNIGHRYLWADAVDILLADQDYWAATDHLGSVNALLDANENIVEHREYDSFGAIDQVFNSAGQSVNLTTMRTDVAHSGSLWDNDAQIYRKGVRPYDPGTGQFFTTDPGGFIDGANLYWYARNNPTLYVDPSGFAAQGNPLNNLYNGLGNLGPSYSAQQLFGGPVSNNRTSANPVSSIYNLGPSYNPVNTGSSSRGSGNNRGGGVNNNPLNLGPVVASAATTAFRNTNPIASTVIDAGIGLGAGALVTVLPPMRGSANQEQSFSEYFNPFNYGNGTLGRHAELDRTIANIQQTNVSKLDGFEYIEAQRTLNQGRAENAARDIQQAAETGIQFNAAALGGSFLRPATTGARPVDATRPQHGTPVHDATAFNTAKAWSGERATVEARFNQQLVDVSGNTIPGFRPDAQRIRVTPSGDRVVDVIEVQSRGQSDAFMNNKVEQIRRALGNQAGSIEWVPPTPGAKR